MASSEEEGLKPMGFTLKIPKFNRPTKENRRGTNKRKRPYSSCSPKDSSSETSIEEIIDVFDFDLDSPGSDIIPIKPISNKLPTSNRKRKKQSKGQILKSLSANAKRMPIPIPSFQMTKMKKEKENELSERLSRLERAFFDEDDEDENDSQHSKGGKKQEHAENKKTSVLGVGVNPHDGSKNITTESSMSEGKSSGTFLRKESSSTKNSRDHVVAATEPDKELPTLQQGDTKAKYETNVGAIRDLNVEETAETVQEVIEKSPRPQHDVGENIGVPIDNNNGVTDESENGNDSNSVDFGGDNGGYDVDGDGDGDCLKLPSKNFRKKTGAATNTILSSEGAYIENADNPYNQSAVSPAFDLDNEVDLLFLKSDTNTITMKLFCKELEHRIGLSLEKPVKKKVKARVMSLLRGEIVPSSSSAKTTGTPGGQGTNKDDDDRISDEKHKILNEKTVSESEDNSSKICTKSNNDGEKNNESEVEELNLSIEGSSISETGCEIEVIGDKSVSNSSKTEDAEKEKTSTNHNLKARQKRDGLDRHQNEVRAENSSIERSLISEKGCKVEVISENIVASSSSRDQRNKTTTLSSAGECKNDKKQDMMQKKGSEILDTSQSIATNQMPDLICVEIEPEKQTISEPYKQTKSKNVITSEAKKQRKRKQKPPGKDKKAAESTKTVSEKKPTQTRKRPRKAAACALCKTCPCQRTHYSNDCENIATLDLKDFSRSDNAVERTLLRRLQKLEKSTESLEEQTETVRRRLKKHQRDASKRRQRIKERTGNADNHADSYFLPDADVFEQQQNESEGLASGVVGKAQTRLFHNVPTRQPTLFEMMGIPRGKEETKENSESDSIDSKGVAGEERICHDPEEVIYADDADIPTEYVPERAFEEKIHRFEWNNNARAANDEGAQINSGSIFDTVFPLTQDARDDDGGDVVKANAATSIPLWDDLFESSKKARENGSAGDTTNAGLDDLLCLFEDGTTTTVDSNEQDGSGCGVGACERKDRIDPNLLSQGAQKVANELILSVPSREMLEESYPHWKENVYFALKQKDPSDLEQALENVQQSRMHLQKEKEEMLRAWERKNAALEVFEKALKASFDRSEPNGSPELEE